MHVSAKPWLRRSLFCLAAVVPNVLVALSCTRNARMLFHGAHWWSVGSILVHYDAGGRWAVPLATAGAIGVATYVRRRTGREASGLIFAIPVVAWLLFGIAIATDGETYRVGYFPLRTVHAVPAAPYAARVCGGLFVCIDGPTEDRVVWAGTMSGRLATAINNGRDNG